MENDTNHPKDPQGLDLKEIRQIVDLMSKNDLSFFHLEHGSFKIKLRRGSDVEAAKDLLSKIPMGATMAAPVAAAPVAVAATPAPAATPVPAAAPAEPAGPTINSPMVGTFYRSSTPGEKAFVNVGDTVDENTVVCII
ncbi:MAG TPA: biotin/lipoyl-containing protein, partial [Candidatus Saccharimonadia bacterium]|nr:biotin/lipoyl-containing protein [Candidatus Saccharimonadia bacterium]